MKLKVCCVLLVLLCVSTSAQMAQQSTSASNSVLRFNGIGAMRVGMTLPQLNAALGEHFSTPTEKDEQTCFNVEPKHHPGIDIMILDGRVARVDVFAPKDVKPSIRTAAGIRIGDSEARVRNVYGKKLAVSPHQYDPDGHYLTVRSGGYWLRFETDGAKVTNFYAGTLEAISFVEGCL